MCREEPHREGEGEVEGEEEGGGYDGVTDCLVFCRMNYVVLRGVGASNLLSCCDGKIDGRLYVC